MKKLSQQELQRLANLLLLKNGFDYDGGKRRKGKKVRGQRSFEKRILMTPMGNGMR